MIYSELQRLCELETKLKKKYGGQVLNLKTHSLICWNEVVAIIRFGTEWSSNPYFLKETNSLDPVKTERFEIKESLLNGNLPSWIKIIS